MMFSLLLCWFQLSNLFRLQLHPSSLTNFPSRYRYPLSHFQGLLRVSLIFFHNYNLILLVRGTSTAVQRKPRYNRNTLYRQSNNATISKFPYDTYLVGFMGHTQANCNSLQAVCSLVSYLSEKTLNSEVIRLLTPLLTLPKGDVGVNQDFQRPSNTGAKIQN